jgi:mercuric reductase
VGGGPIGCELAQVFGRLGSTVTQIAGDCLLPRDEPEAGATLQKIFEHEGINVIQERVTNVASSGTNKHVVTCSKGTQVTGDVLLVAIGRKPTVTGMDLEMLGVELNAKGGIHVNAQLMTTVKGLYAAGDCTGDVQL